MLDVKEESPADTGVSDVPVFTGARESAQSTPASTFTSDSRHSLKPEGEDILVPPPATAATVASITILSDTLPATPYSLPTTPPLDQYFDNASYSADKHGTAAAETPTTTARPAADLLNNTPSDSASEPTYARAQDADAASPAGSLIVAFGASELSGEAAASEDPTAPTARVVAESPGRALAMHAQSSEADGSSERSFVSYAGTNANAPDAISSESITVSSMPPLVDPDTSAEAAPTIDATSSRRPVRMVQQARIEAIAKELERKASRAAARASAKHAAKQAAKSPAQALAESPAKAKRTSLSTAQPEKRATRLSGAAAETPSPQITLGKRRRGGASSPANEPSGLRRELRRLQDTKEFSHRDEQPVIYTVWSNGKYVPANAAGEPLPERTTRKRAKTTETTEARTGNGEAADASPWSIEDDPAGAPKPAQKRVKKWLSKGLYAGQMMPENPTAGLTASERRALAKLPELAKKTPPNKTLPAPIYNGMRMLLQGRDFKMPFDVFNPLPPGQPKPVKYGRFRKSELPPNHSP